MANSTLDCREGVPSVAEFFAGFQQYLEFLLIVPTAFCMTTLTLYVINLRELAINGQRETKGNVVALFSIYPIVACSSLVSIVVPRTYFFCDTISHISFVIISYQFYRLCMNYVEGESKFIAISKEETFSLRAPPCCCCFACFKKSSITKRKFKILRFLVLQMAVVHVVIFLTLNLISIERPEVIDNIMNYFVPFIAGTIILRRRGFPNYQITIRMLVPYYASLNLLKKFLSFQLILIFCKLQPVLINLALQQVIVDCDGPFTIVVKIRAITQTTIQVEMVMLSFWAHTLYKS